MVYQNKPIDYVTEKEEAIEFGKDGFIQVSISYPKDAPEKRFARISRGWYKDGKKNYRKGGVSFPPDLWDEIRDAGDKVCGGNPQKEEGGEDEEIREEKKVKPVGVLP